MDPYFSRQQMDFVRFARRATLVALAIASVLIALYYATAFPFVAFLGIFHFLASAIISCWVAVRLLGFLKRRRSPRTQIALTLSMIVLSYAVAAFYLYIGLGVYSNSSFD